MFALFPTFTPLSLEDKEEYNRFVADFPPYSDLSFITLHIWWNLDEKLRVSLLNDNLIISYDLPFDEANSGYSLVGKHAIDESIETIFDQLRHENKPVKLVHVPEFVAKAIKKPEKFELTEEQDYNEYILDSHAMAKLEGGEHGRTRRKVGRFLREVEGRKIETKALDLDSEESKDQIFQAIKHWNNLYPNANDPENTEHQAITKTLTHASTLGIRGMGLYIDEELYAVILYHKPASGQHYIVHHHKANYSVPRIVDYTTQQIANQALEENVPFINLEMDLGIAGLREHKQGLKPVDFFRKFTIIPQ